MPDFDRIRRYLSIPSPNAARIAREVGEELQLHIDLRTDALVRQGMPVTEARARAMREFGDVDDATRYCLDMDREAARRRQTRGWLGEIFQDTRHAMRVLRRTPAFAAATVLTLALAIGASTAVYAVLDTYLVRPLPFPASDRLMSIGNAPTSGNGRGPSLENVDWSRADSLFEATASWDLDGFTISGEPYAESATGAWVSPGYFVALGLQPAMGRRFHDDEYRAETPVAIISHNLWVRRFAADSGVLGRVVTMHSTDRPAAASLVTIVGVLPRGAWPIQWRVSDVLRPMPPDRHWMPQLARLAPNASRRETEVRFNALIRAQIGGEAQPEWRMALVPALERHSQRARPLLFAVFGAALFMLLAACGSVAGALVSRVASRQRELAIRLALGGSRARVVRQLLTESAVLATLAGALGLTIAYALLVASGTVIERQLGTTTPGGAQALRPTLELMGQCLIVSALTGIALGVLPVQTFLRFRQRSGPTALLGAGRNGGFGGASHLRRILIAGQVAVAMVLLFGAGLMFRTLAQMGATNLGFRADGVARASLMLPLDRYSDSTVKHQIMGRLLDGIARVPGVRGVATVAPSPFGGNWRFPVSVDGVPDDEASAPQAAVFTVSPAYFETMAIRRLGGRTFSATEDQAAPLVVVVSEGLAARIAPGGDVIGRRIRVRVPYLASFDDRDDRPWRTVIGVVGDTRKDFAPNNPPDIYVPYAQNPRSFQSIAVRADRAESAIIEPVRRAVTRIDPALALFDAEPLSNVIAAHGAQRRGLSVLLGAFAVFAVCLSALALYASLSYTVVQRRSELALRIAVGATARSILGLVVAEGLITAAIGVAVGVLASLALGRVLEHQLYGVGAGDPATLATIAFVLTIAAITACLVPGVRATRADPVLALRE